MKIESVKVRVREDLVIELTLDEVRELKRILEEITSNPCPPLYPYYPHQYPLITWRASTDQVDNPMIKAYN